MNIKSFILSHEPFKPLHFGTWMRLYYFKKFINSDLIGSKKINYALDAGCGRGQHTFMLNDKFNNCNIDAIDIAEAKEWKVNNKYINFKKLDLNDLDEKDKYDLVVSIDCLEHIRNNDEVFKKIYNSLKQDGLFYFAIPCEHDELYILPKKFFYKFFLWEEDEHIGEQRKLDEWIDLANRVGYKIINARHTFTFFGHLAWELEFIIRSSKYTKRLNIILMPFYKLLGLIDFYLPIGKGNNLLILKK